MLDSAPEMAYLHIFYMLITLTLKLSHVVVKNIKNTRPHPLEQGHGTEAKLRGSLPSDCSGGQWLSALPLSENAQNPHQSDSGVPSRKSIAE